MAKGKREIINIHRALGAVPLFLMALEADDIRSAQEVPSQYASEQEDSAAATSAERIVAPVFEELRSRIADQLSLLQERNERG